MGNEKPWQKGDEPLSPFEERTEPIEHLTPYERLRQNLWYNQERDVQERALEALLGHYLHDEEVKYYTGATPFDHGDRSLIFSANNQYLSP